MSITEAEKKAYQAACAAAYQAAFAAQSAFRELNAEALASFPSDTVAEALLANLRLEHQAEIIAHAGDFAEAVSLLETAFLDLYDRGILIPNAPLTARGEKAIQEMRERTGVREAGYEAPLTPQEAAQNAEQELREQVEFDWQNLGSAEVKRKAAASPAYRNMLNQLLEGDSIGSGATTFSRIASAPDGNQYGRR